MSEPFIAEVRIFAGNFAPRGWAFCNGQLLPISQNTALFSLIDTTFGGDGRTTTGLPNLQGKAPMHPGNGPSLTQRRLGETGGTDYVILSLNQIPQHTHTHQTINAFADDNDPGPDMLLAPSPRMDAYAMPTGVGPMADEALLPQGGNQAHNNMQPYLTLNFIIALVGLYPSRN
jgi:microcystin-dependent protein